MNKEETLYRKVVWIKSNGTKKEIFLPVKRRTPVKATKPFLKLYTNN